MRRLFVGALVVVAVLPLFGNTLTYDNAALRPLTLARDCDRLTISDSHSQAILVSAPAATTERVFVRGAGGDRNDVLTIDLTEPFALRGGIDYDGGARGFDVLELRGGSARLQRVTQLTPHDGIIDIDGLVIRYSNLEPITDTAPAAAFVVNGTPGLDTVTVTNGPGGTTTISSPTFESVTFANKTSVVFDGMGGGDTVVFNNPTPATGLTSFIVQNVATVSQTGAIVYPSFGVSATGNVILTFSSNDVNNVEIATTGGNVEFTDSDDLTVNGSVTTGAGGGDIVLASFGTDGITIAGPVLAQTGDVTVRTPRLLIPPAGSIGAPAGRVLIEAVGFPPNVDLGATADTPNAGLELSDAEIDRITAPVLSVETFTGVITVSQPISFGGHLILRSPNAFTATGTGSLSAPTLTFDFTFGGTRTWTITPTSVQVSGGTPIPYSGVTTLNVNTSIPSAHSTGPGSETFVVTPSATTTINIDAGQPWPSDAPPHDTLDFELAGVVSPVLTATLANDGYTGSLTSANRQPIHFAEIERFIDAPVDLQVTKTDDFTARTAGQDVTYRVTVRNQSGIVITGVAVADVIPPQLTNATWICNGAGASCTGSGTGNINDTITLMPMGTAQYHITGIIDPAFTGTLTNTATVTAPPGWVDTNPANNSATDTTEVTAQASLIVTKSGPAGSPSAGDTLTYTVTLRNAGPSSAQNVSLTDVIPANTSFVSLAAAAGYTCSTPADGGTGTVTCTRAVLAPSATADTFTLVVRASGTAPAGTVITNTAAVTTTTPESPPGDNSATAVTTLASQSDLIVTKSGPAGTTFAGGDLTYTITLRNAGPSDAQSVTLTDAIPANTRFVSFAAAPGYTCATPAGNGTGTVTCTRAVLPPSPAADTFTLTVRVDRPAAAGTTITNTATATTTTPDPAANNSATAPAIAVAEVSIPTLSEWMLLFLAIVLALVAVKMAT